MADPKPLTRAQLARFLQDAEAIKAFERLFEVAGDEIPTAILELSYLANTLKSRIHDAFRQIAEMENIQPRPARQNADGRIAEIESLQPRSANFNNIEIRLNELEIQLSRRSNDDALLRRIEILEQLVGV